MGFQTFTLGGNAGHTSGLNVTRTLIAAQTTPVSIKLGQGNVYSVYAIASGTAAAFVQYFTHGGVTLGVSAPAFEVAAAQQVTVSGIATANIAAWSGGGIPIPFNGTATTSGIWVAAGVAASTGTNVAADTVIVYTVWA